MESVTTYLYHKHCNCDQFKTFENTPEGQVKRDCHLKESDERRQKLAVIELAEKLLIAGCGTPNESLGMAGSFLDLAEIYLNQK